jgi:hypothetical protein
MYLSPVAIFTEESLSGEGDSRLAGQEISRPLW